MFSMFKYLNPLTNIPLNVYKKLFESLVRPILTYNSEIWYMDFYEKVIKSLNRSKDNPKFDIISLIDTSYIEKSNLKFCKFILGLSKQAVNIAARAELAQYPLDTFIKMQSVKYLIRFLSRTSNPLLDDAFILSKNLHTNGTYSWYSYVNNICISNDIDLNKLEYLNQTSLNNMKQKLKKKI